MSPEEQQAYIEQFMPGVTEGAAMPDMSSIIAMLPEDQQAIVSELPPDQIMAYIENLSGAQIESAVSPSAEGIDLSAIDMSAFDMSSISEEQMSFFMSMSEEQRTELMKQLAGSAFKASSVVSASSLFDNLKELGVISMDTPSSISIYPKDFEAKERVVEIINDYNKGSPEDKQITYTDIVGMLMSSVTDIINAISYILIAFVAISLIVSSIMIGIITYISVLERTKEIGILRSIGASRKDVSRVFNAETIIIGFIAGALGILVTCLMIIPINYIIQEITEIENLAKLPPLAAVLLIAISVVLTLIAGLFPSGVAARKDPVVALRTE